MIGLLNALRAYENEIRDISLLSKCIHVEDKKASVSLDNSKMKNIHECE